MNNNATPIQRMDAGWWAKRDDTAAGGRGAKFRQYAKMIESQLPGLPLVVGCAASSAMPYYMVHAGQTYDRPVHVFCPERKTPTPTIGWAAARGATIHPVRPGYMTVVRKRARDYINENGGAVRWCPNVAITDTAAELVATGVPDGCRRIVVPTGSGATAAGVLLGLANIGRLDVPILCVAVSTMADLPGVYDAYRPFEPVGAPVAKIDLVRHPYPYEKPHNATLPNGDSTDPWYAGKCVEYVKPGDMLWIAGNRLAGLLPGVPAGGEK